MTIPTPTDSHQRGDRQVDIYVLRDHAGDCLYVGQTTQLSARLHKHARTQPWWPEVATVEVEQVSIGLSRTPALVREAELMIALQPRHSRPTKEIAALAGGAR